MVITGVESTGKSTLCAQLAKEYNGLFVPEYARLYLNENGTNYEAEDIYKIAKKMIAQREELYDLEASSIVFFDTDLINIKIWLEYEGKAVPDWIIAAIKREKFDLYFLMNIDISWQADPLRKNKLNRVELFQLFEKNLQSFSIPYHLISGVGNSRLNLAKQYIDAHYRNL